MKLANIGGQPVLLTDEGYKPLLNSLDQVPSFRDVIARWSTYLEGAERAESWLDLGDHPRFGPPVPVPGKIVGAPVNYLDHQREMNAAHTIAGLGFFLKSPTSIIGPASRVPLPFPDRRTDQEAELGVVIGRTAEHVSATDALDYVFGYTCLVDVTVRGDEERSTRKSFPGFTPIGPWITTADDVGDPTDLRIRGWVGDELRQDASTADMIYPVARLIEFISSVIPLHPGDIIATGTPAGVGPIQPGDTIRVDIERVGQLAVDVVAGSRKPHALWLAKETAS